MMVIILAQLINVFLKKLLWRDDEGLFVHRAVVIGFEMTEYTTDEGTSVNLVIRVVEGEIMQNTVVSLSTTDGTATSEQHSRIIQTPL